MKGKITVISQTESINTNAPKKLTLRVKINCDDQGGKRGCMKHVLGV
jgi:hypothetical protein